MKWDANCHNSFYRKIRDHRSGLTFMEILIATAIFLTASIGILYCYAKCLELNEIGRGSTIALQAVKRFHDLDRPGTHFWLLLIPIYGIYIGLLLLFKKGTEGPNRF